MVQPAWSIVKHTMIILMDTIPAILLEERYVLLAILTLATTALKVSACTCILNDIIIIIRISLSLSLSLSFLFSQFCFSNSLLISYSLFFCFHITDFFYSFSLSLYSQRYHSLQGRLSSYWRLLYSI